MTWNEAIREALKITSTSQSELARRLDYQSASSINKIVRGHQTPAITAYAKIMSALEVNWGCDATGWWVERP